MDDPMKSDMFSHTNSPGMTDHLHQSAQLAAKELLKKRPEWSEDSPSFEVQGKLTAEILDKFPVYRKFQRDNNGALVLPNDPNVLLSEDELVYAAMKELTLVQRARFRGVWDKNGEPRASRVPQDPAPKIDRQITLDSAPVSMESTPDPEPPSQSTEEKLIRRYILQYDSIAQQPEIAEPIIKRLMTIDMRLREYDDLQAEQRRLTSIIKDTKATQLAAINNLSSLGLAEAYERAVQRWQDVFCEVFPGHKPSAQQEAAAQPEEPQEATQQGSQLYDPDRQVLLADPEDSFFA